MSSINDRIVRREAPFKINSAYQPAGDQPQAIAGLTTSIRSGNRYQTLLGVTGSGKTFSIAHVLATLNRPALIIAPNKTLAAQLYGEFKEFFPENNVRYFVSYYDYYQPEAYVPSTDTYIEKDAAINEEIDKMRHSATRALLEYRDTIVVASVSCIYGLGAPEDYFEMMLFAEQGQSFVREAAVHQLVTMQYKRSDVNFVRGTFRVRGDTLDIFPSDQHACALRLVFFGDEIEEIREIDPISGATVRRVPSATVYPVSHFVAKGDRVSKAIVTIKEELKQQIVHLLREGKQLEAQRLERRTLYDLELMDEVGFCPGIENYSRHLAGRNAGDPPTTLVDYFPKDFLLIIDESHVTYSQLQGMYRGDQSRKRTLVDHGFRLPSALDNRPLNAEEFWSKVGQTIFVSATPGETELALSKPNIVEQINRPTGLLDPEVIIRPATNQVDDLLNEIRSTVEKGERVLALTLTKRMAEDLAGYLREIRVKAKYIHADIQTIERTELLRGLRKGEFDVLIGINLLREGLDLVEVSLVAILDADKEGFLRSTRSLIQIMGRAARNVNGRVVMYADTITQSMQGAIAETNRRRAIQRAYNEAHGITPQSARSAIKDALVAEVDEIETAIADLGVAGSLPKTPQEQQRLLEDLRRQMFDAAARREFERAAELRDAIHKIQQALLA